MVNNDFGFTAYDQEQIFNEDLIKSNKIADLESRLSGIEGAIMPLLEKLKENPNKEYLKWVDRDVVIQRHIDAIRKLTQPAEV
jgi:hypothetical protein